MYLILLIGKLCLYCHAYLSGGQVSCFRYHQEVAHFINVCGFWWEVFA